MPVDAAILRAAERLIVSCEACEPDRAEVPFDYVLDAVTGFDPEYTDYVLAKAAHCPNCRAVIQAGYWRWQDSDTDGRTVFILPSTLVCVKNEF